jgi:hypothetical protein
LGDGKRRALASHLIRKLQNGRRPVLTTDFFRSLEDRDLPTAAEASDSLLLWFAESADGNLGKFNPINPSDQALQASIGVISATDLIYVSDALKDQGLVENMQGASSAAMRLTPNGWLRVEQLKRAHAASKYAFFARKFDNPDLDRVFDDCLRPAVAATGYELRPVTQRAGLVDAVIEDEIRRCRFLIADLSDDNAGAYWEAGLAEGLGKPVIYVCRAKVGTEEKRTHFDANHRHTVRWDLSPGGMRLTQWRRTPFRTRHRLLALAINDALGHWRSCVDRRCRRARFCQDHECYWRRLEQLTTRSRCAREAAAPLAKLLWIGCTKGSEGQSRF